MPAADDSGFYDSYVHIDADDKTFDPSFKPRSVCSTPNREAFSEQPFSLIDDLATSPIPERFSATPFSFRKTKWPERTHNITDELLSPPVSNAPTTFQNTRFDLSFGSFSTATEIGRLTLDSYVNVPPKDVTCMTGNDNIKNSALLSILQSAPLNAGFNNGIGFRKICHQPKQVLPFSACTIPPHKYAARTMVRKNSEIIDRLAQDSPLNLTSDQPENHCDGSDVSLLLNKTSGSTCMSGRQSSYYDDISDTDEPIKTFNNDVRHAGEVIKTNLHELCDPDELIETDLNDVSDIDERIKTDLNNNTSFSDDNNLPIENENSVFARPIVKVTSENALIFEKNKNENEYYCELSEKAFRLKVLTSSPNGILPGRTQSQSREGVIRTIPSPRRSRKLSVPRRGAERVDPKFRGATVWIQTEFKDGESKLQISAFYRYV